MAATPLSPPCRSHSAPLPALSGLWRNVTPCHRGVEGPEDQVGRSAEPYPEAGVCSPAPLSQEHHELLPCRLPHGLTKAGWRKPASGLAVTPAFTHVPFPLWPRNGRLGPTHPPSGAASLGPGCREAGRRAITDYTDSGAGPVPVPSLKLCRARHRPLGGDVICRLNLGLALLRDPRADKAACAHGQGSHQG